MVKPVGNNTVSHLIWNNVTFLAELNKIPTTEPQHYILHKFLKYLVLTEISDARKYPFSVEHGICCLGLFWNLVSEPANKDKDKIKEKTAKKASATQ